MRDVRIYLLRMSVSTVEFVCCPAGPRELVVLSVCFLLLGVSVGRQLSVLLLSVCRIHDVYGSYNEKNVRAKVRAKVRSLI